MSTILKPTVANIIHLWFGADTPIRREKIRLNYALWQACQQANRRFSPPSGNGSPATYRRSDRVAFAQLVLQELAHSELLLETSYQHA